MASTWAPPEAESEAWTPPEAANDWTPPEAIETKVPHGTSWPETIGQGIAKSVTGTSRPLVLLGKILDFGKEKINEAVPGFLEQATTSPLPATHLQPEKSDSILTALGKAGVNTATGLVEAVTTPAMAALIPAGAANQTLGKMIAGGFAADMVTHIPGQVEQAIKAPTLQGKIEGGLGAALSALFAVGGAAHAGGLTERLRPVLGEKTESAIPEPVRPVEAPATEPVAPTAEPKVDAPISPVPAESIIADAAGTEAVQAPLPAATEIPATTEISAVQKPEEPPAPIPAQDSASIAPNEAPQEIPTEQAKIQAEGTQPEATAPGEVAPPKPEVAEQPLPQYVVSKTASDLSSTVEKAVPAPDRQAVKEFDKQDLNGDQQSHLQTVLKTLGLSREDLTAVGATAPGTGRTSLLIDRAKSKVRDMADMIGGKVVPKLTRAGVMDEATQHASARQYVPALVEELLAKVFPEKYHDADAMARTMDVIKKDNILGGYDAARIELEALRQSEPPGSAKLAAQEEFVGNIEAAHDLAKLDADVSASKGTDIAADVKRWEEHVSPLLNELYNEMKDVDPATERDSRGRHYEARMNLLPMSEVERLAEFSDQNMPMPETVVSNYRNPNVKRDKFMQQARLTGEYSNDAQAVLLNSLAGRWNEVTKIRLYKALEAKGVAMVADSGTPPVKEIGGKPAARMPIRYPETNPETGRTQMVEKSLYVQRDLVNEIRNVLNTDGKLTTNPFFQAITQVQLLQLADATAHTKNIHSVVVNALGSESLGRDLLRKIPLIGSADAVTEITKVSRQIAEDSPAIRSEIADLAKHGMIRPEYPSTGIQKITRMQELIHSVDTASRVIMNRRFDNLVERGLAKDTIETRRNFIQQIGEYNRRLMSRQEAFLRDYGLSPFIVAGRTFNRFSRRLVAGSPGFEAASGRAAIAARAAQLSGLVLAATLPATINMFTTGSMGGREGTPVGAIDFGPSFDTRDGKRRILDLFQLTGIRRGLRGTGIEAAIEGLRQGKTKNEILGDALEGIKTTALHPYIGPGLGAMYQILTGKRIDLRTGFMSIPEGRKFEGAKQYVENARIALKQQNPFLYGIAQDAIHSGMDKVFGIPPAPEELSVSGQIGSGLLKSPLSAVGYKELATPASKKLAKAERKKQKALAAPSKLPAR